jgi:hypothetical protein
MTKKRGKTNNWTGVFLGKRFIQKEKNLLSNWILFQSLLFVCFPFTAAGYN